MTKNPRDHRDWTNRDIEENPQAYLAAQAAHREDKAIEVRRKHDADDLARYKAAQLDTRKEAHQSYMCKEE
jgi:hypothetical protein